MLELFWDTYGPVVFALAAYGLVALWWRAEAGKQKKQDLHRQTLSKARTIIAQANEQGHSLHITLPQWDDEEIPLGQARFMEPHAEGMRLEMWIRPGSPVLNYEQVHVYFHLINKGPIVHYDFLSSMHEYCRDGNRVEVIVPWPEELGNAPCPVHEPSPHEAEQEAQIRLWRTAQGPDPLSPQCWEALPEYALLITDISGQHLRFGLERREAMHLREGHLMLSRMVLPYAEAEPIEIMLAGKVQSLVGQPHLSHDAVILGWQRWALSAENVNDMEWFTLEPGQAVPILQNWVGLRRQMA